MTSRSVIQRIFAVVGLILLSAYLFYIGKGHTLLIDTNEVTINGKEMRSAQSVTVSIDGKEQDPMGRGERILVTVSGPAHTIVIVDDSDSDKKIEKSLRIPTFMGTAIVSVPAILGNAPDEYWLTPFTPPPAEDTPAEQMHHEGEDTTMQAPPGQTPESTKP